MQEFGLRVGSGVRSGDSAKFWFYLFRTGCRNKYRVRFVPTERDAVGDDSNPIARPSDHLLVLAAASMQSLCNNNR